MELEVNIRVAESESEVLGRSRSRTVKRTRSRSRNILSDSDSSCPISLHIGDVNRATYAAARGSGVQRSNLREPCRVLRGTACNS